MILHTFDERVDGFEAEVVTHQPVRLVNEQDAPEGSLICSAVFKAVCPTYPATNPEASVSTR